MKNQHSSWLFVAAVAALALAMVALQNSLLRSEEPRKKGTGIERGDAEPVDNLTRPSLPPLAKGGSEVQGPQYTNTGELKRPTGYETWVFVGSNLGLEYSDDVTKERPVEKEGKEKKKPAKGANFHNVYINPEAYAAYVKTGKFPEKTVLILDVFKAEERERRNIVSEGLFPGPQVGLAVAVKNSARADGSKTDWAYYDFGLEAKTAKAFADKACYECHVEHADDDNVWVQFYPTLRKAREVKGKGGGGG